MPDLVRGCTPKSWELMMIRILAATISLLVAGLTIVLTGLVTDAASKADVAAALAASEPIITEQRVLSATSRARSVALRTAMVAPASSGRGQPRTSESREGGSRATPGHRLPGYYVIYVPPF